MKLFPLLSLVASLGLSRASEPVKFSSEVLPILSTHCFACHGPDEHDRKAKLRLDMESDAKAEHGDGLPIAPGHPEKSSVITRMTSTDEDEVMPPLKAHKTVKPEQIELLKRWIAEGAKWGRHWSFEPVVKPAGTLDTLVSAALEQKGLQLRDSAAPQTLVRRLWLDIVGLPPTPEMADAFAAGPTPDAYERMVDDLLKKPQFGEHWARVWLDLARYADTKGYEKDLNRNIWLWRDWVVQSLNDDMHLDRFTEEQIAGDLLPKASEPQIIATAFHRNTMTNDEGGTDNEEFRQVAVKDRVDTTMQVWMGLTMGCAKCHSHKYDPISQSEYFSFYAMFNQTADTDLHSDAPLFSKPTPEQQKQLNADEAKVAEITRRLDGARKADPKATKGNAAEPADSPEIAKIKTELKTAQDKVAKLKATIITVPIMTELPKEKQRETKIHKRGNFLDLGDVVQPGVPSAFHPLTPGTPLNRLGVARWLVSQDNTLTPRVWANRVWARLSGMGIVETEEDFGALGSAPVNQPLLDWLAASYRDDGWSLKKLIKLIVMSKTYRQSSVISGDVVSADPRNGLASRGARYRLAAEVVRDQALSIGGLLSLKQGGPPVMPPQPAGMWRSTYNAKSWIDAEGEDRFRRGLYTYLKRTTPYPTLTTFDGGSGEVCQIRRIRTNTPLQALITLNDPVYLEAAAALARRMVIDAPDALGRASRGLRLALIRPLRVGEAQPLLTLQKEMQAAFAAAPADAGALIKTTRAAVPEGMSQAEFAAWINVASTILNLDEVLNRN
jgi:Protein of unknown function (DUF1549)/Protein of unknown function (DUF1553)/Planctomycete cytochrome C